MTDYRTIRVDVTHPIAEINGTVKGPRAVKATVYEHKYVLYEKIGPGSHPCHWCGRELQWLSGTRGDAVIADHINGDKLDNRPENLVPACNGCNTMRGREHFRPAIGPDELFVVSKSGQRTRADWVTCEICGKVFLAELARINRGTVSLCSKSCSGIRGSRSRWG